MSLYKRGSTWWVKFTTPSGEPIRQSSKTTDKKAAQEFHDTLKAKYWRQDVMDGERVHIWEEAAGRYLAERREKLSAKYHPDKVAQRIHEIVLQLRWLDQYLAGKDLRDISRNLVKEITEEKPAVSANRHTALVRVILRKAAFEWEDEVNGRSVTWLQKAPRLYVRPEKKRRIRYLSPEERERLWNEVPPHMQLMAVFAFHTGLRMSNVTQLRWDQVNLSMRVAMIGETKNEEPVGIYINSEAAKIIRDQIGKHDEYVFTYRGNPVKQCSTKAWSKAKARANIADFRWHDWRHDWASAHVQNGTPIFALCEQGNWKDVRMLSKYAALSAPHFAEHGEKMGTNSGTVPVRKK